MNYEIERDVKIEIVDESDGRLYESGHSVAGLGRCATRMPRFTEKEIRAELGDKTCDDIESIFADVQTTSSD